MAATRKIQASQVVAGNRSLEAVLVDMAERSARCDERIARCNEHIEQHSIEIRAIVSGMFALATRMDERLRTLENRPGSEG
jgi:hypothetical protein